MISQVCCDWRLVISQQYTHTFTQYTTMYNPCFSSTKNEQSAWSGKWWKGAAPTLKCSKLQKNNSSTKYTFVNTFICKMYRYICFFSFFSMVIYYKSVLLMAGTHQKLTPHLGQLSEMKNHLQMFFVHSFRFHFDVKQLPSKHWSWKQTKLEVVNQIHDVF